MINVQLLAYTPEPEKVISTAAKLCYANSNIDDLQDGLTDEKVKSFVEMLMSMGHESPIEHVTFTFGIEGISRACSHQLVRHRLASYSQQSQRYVTMTDFDYVTPPVISDDSELNSLYENIMNDLASKYNELQNAITNKVANKYIDTGMDEKKAKQLASKIANEDARFILPNACTTKIIVTMNARSLFNFFGHRCCNRAQWEIREVAEQMYKLVYDIAPTLFSKTGPHCVSSGKCPEGKMTCGKMKEMKEKYEDFRK